MFTRIGYVVLFWLLAAPASPAPRQHAILIGISDYPVIRSLEGPLHDVALIKSILLDHWQFEAANILTLTNEQASKKNILDAIISVRADGKAGDTVFVYFSGHGTSAADSSLPVSIPAKTGALIPYDISGVETEQELMNRLIIGKRDLQPALMELDRAGFGVFVVIDACYSGNVIRDKKPLGKLPTRFVRFGDLLSKIPRKTKLSRRLEFNQDEPFPYRNVFSLSAAQEYETAQDIPSNMLKQYPTVDGKPHGAFTDSLARVLSGVLDGDVDGNKALTLDELSEAVKRSMYERRFTSTPQLLPRHAEAGGDPAKQVLFGPPFETYSSAK